MSNKITILLLLISCFAFSQTELLPTIAWQTKVLNVEQLTDSTYKFSVFPLDWNEPGAATMQYGNYFQDFAGNTYEIIDSAYLSVTVLDIFETGVSPQVNQVGIMYDAPFDAEYLAPIRYQVLDQSALDNARARELAYLWRQANLYAQDSSYMVWWNDTIETIATKSDVPTYLNDLNSTGFDIDTSQVRDLQTFVENNSGEVSISGTEGYIPKFGASGLTESGVFESATGNVGIGTTNPAEKLEVNGNIKADSINGVVITNAGTGDNYLSDDGTYKMVNVDLNLQDVLDNGNTATNQTIQLADGGSSVYVGTFAGVNDDRSDNRNVGVGYYALFSNTTGSNNTANGFQALFSNTTGSNNTANGFQALRSNTTGNNNTANGTIALYSNTTGIRNTANGYYALFSNTTGNSNTANGMIALYDLDSINSNNTAVGYNTGRGIVTGDNNTILGAQVTGLAPDLNNNIIFATGDGVIQQRFDGTNWNLQGNVGIGKTNPAEKLEVNGNIKADSIKTVGIQATGDVVFDLTSPEKFKVNYAGTTIMETNPAFAMIYYKAPFIWDGGQGLHPNHVPTIGQMKDSIKALSPLHNSEGKLIDLFNSSDGTQRISVDLSETQYYENTTQLDQFVYIRGSEYCRTPMYTLQAYLQDNLDFSGGGAVTAIYAGSLVDVSGSTGNVTVNVDLSEATSDNTFTSTDQLVYLSGTTQKRGTIAGLESYMQSNLDFGTGGGMVYPSAGIPVSTGSSWGTSITNNSSNWNTAYTDRMKWDGGSTGLNATTGRTSLGLGSMATKSFWTGTQTQYDNLSSYDSNTIYFIED